MSFFFVLVVGFCLVLWFSEFLSFLVFGWFSGFFGVCFVLLPKTLFLLV